MQKSREGDLKAAGILRVEDVGEQIARVFKLKKMADLATRLLGYQRCHDQMGMLSAIICIILAGPKCKCKLCSITVDYW